MGNNNLSLKNIYYKGTKEDWDKIEIGYDNSILEDFTYYFETSLSASGGGGGSASSSSGACGANLSWTLDGNGILTISGTGEMYDYEYEESPWHDNDDIKYLVIKEGVTSIGSYAFHNCFNLMIAEIPSTVSRISSEGIFLNCIGLYAFYVSENSSSFCSEDGVLFSKDGATLVRYPEIRPAMSYTVPDGVKTIGSYAFFDCQILDKITLPNGLEVIQNNAFDWCLSLSSINIPGSVTFIGERAFVACNFNKISLPEGITEISEGTFADCVSLEEIDIPGTVTIIDYDAFAACDSLKTVNYTGTEEDWRNIEIMMGNSCLESAAVSYKGAPVTASGISLDQKSLTLSKGDTYLLTATVHPEEAEDKTVIWTSSDNSIATVENGFVTVLKEGHVKITAKTANGKYWATCYIWNPPANIAVNERTDGETKIYTVTSDKEATNKKAYAVAYKDGRMVGMYSAVFSGTNTVELKLPADIDKENVKIFVWDTQSQLVPASNIIIK